ncbi:hypothetical protein B6V74_14805 [Thioclava sp. F42-5]|uniref:helix-turn-helix domain-containing protein n=1 Tax=Thioclava sp. F42-5 TaxID=1973005 RepID=UPI000B53B741|nr:helix-turn-helix transcriptional regulator [Thioclava sp. F42-5]OWY08406.1 hypothetical protein B6V74_14805 [Thioclava sp. F42-5]
MAQKLLVPLAVKRELQRIGNRIRAARLARNLPMQLVAERAMTTRQTVGRIEAGDPKVSFGTVLAVLNGLGMLESVSGIASAKSDPFMEAKTVELRSRRARLPGNRRRKASPEDGT